MATRLADTPTIVSDPAVMMGKPVIARTRITVELILDKLAAGESVEQIVEAHPRLSRKAIQAARRACQRGADQRGSRAGAFSR